MKKAILILSILAVAVGCRYAGNVEFNDCVLSSMSESKYAYILTQCNGNHKAIVKEYLSKQQYYDKLKY